MTDHTAHPWFFCGIGGSGMLPLALILHGAGAAVAGSDRSRDQGRTPEKFAWLESLGFVLHPQDGSGIVSAEQTLVASAAVENTVPEVVRAAELGCPRMSRAELLSKLFNASPMRVAIGGTSGKSTVTGMVGWIMDCVGRDPTIMNGAVMKNYVSQDAPFASARVGKGGLFVSEVDESDGSIALYRPTVGVLNNVSLDHKSIEELRDLFGNFLQTSQTIVVNADDPEAARLGKQRSRSNVITFGIEQTADIYAHVYDVGTSGTMFSVYGFGQQGNVALQIPGQHNVLNAMAAMSTAFALGVPLERSSNILTTFDGIARRFDVIGTSPGGVTVIDDFGHNPDKIAATLRTLKDGDSARVIAFFQPHGYGPLRQMGAELAQTFARLLGSEDLTILCDPVYFGGTVDQSEGSERIVRLIRETGGNAEYIPARDDCAARIVQLARPGDRVVIMGARDDTLALFARDVLSALA